MIMEDQLMKNLLVKKRKREKRRRKRRGKKGVKVRWRTKKIWSLEVRRLKVRIWRAKMKKWKMLLR